jgi:hypothetical protein
MKYVFLSLIAALLLVPIQSFAMEPCYDGLVSERMDISPPSSPEMPRPAVKAVFSPVKHKTPKKEVYDANLRSLDRFIVWDAANSNLGLQVPDYFRKILAEQFHAYRDAISRWDPRIDCPEKYLANLVGDPALAGVLKKKKKGWQNTVLKFALEALAGLEAVQSGKIKGPIIRGPVKIEFYNDTCSYDVKTSRNRHMKTYAEDELNALNPHVKQHLDTLVDSIHKELTEAHRHPLSDSNHVFVILDASYLSENKASLLMEALSQKFAAMIPNPDDRIDFLRARIIKVDIRHALNFYK